MSEGRSSASYGSHTVFGYYSVLRNYFFYIGIGSDSDRVIFRLSFKKQHSAKGNIIINIFRTFYQVPNIRVLWKLKPMDTVFFGVQRQLTLLQLDRISQACRNNYLQSFNVQS